MKNTIISVPTKEEWIKVMEKLINEMGYRWRCDGKEIHESWWIKDSVIWVEDRLSTSKMDYVLEEKNKEKYKDYKVITTEEFLGKQEFKIGDKIRGISCDIGDCEGIIRRVESDGYAIEITKIGDKSHHGKGEWIVGNIVDRGTFWENCIELMEEQKFKVGDKVKNIGNTSILQKGMKGKIMVIEKGLIGVEWDKKIDGHSLNGKCKQDYGWWVNENNLELLKEDPKCEEITLTEIFSLTETGIFNGNFPHEGKIEKMRTFLLRKLNPSKRVLYERGYIRENLSLTEEGQELLMDILADKFEKEMVEVAKEEEKEE